MRRLPSALGHLAASVLLTWPMAAHLGDRLAQGSESVGTVGYFNLWTLRWNQERLTHGLSGYWDAPIFHPTRGAFALSEPQPLTGLAFTPISQLSGNPVFAYGLVVLAAMTLNGMLAARLARRIGVAPAAAFAAGLWAQALPFVAGELGVLQLIMVFPFFGLLDALLAWSADGRRRDALLAGVWLAAAFGTCGYYGLFAAGIVGPAALLLVRRERAGRQALDAAVGLAAFGLLAGPFLAAQAHNAEGYRRSTAAIETNSASPNDWLRLPDASWGAAVADAVGLPDSDQHLFPGLVLLVAAATGIASTCLRSRATATSEPTCADDTGLAAIPATVDGEMDLAEQVEVDRGEGPPRRAVAFLLAIASGGAVLSFGLNLRVGDARPYELVRTLVPGFDDLRSPFRAAALTQVALVPLAAMGLDHLGRQVRTRVPQPRLALAALVAVTALGLAEVAAIPVVGSPAPRLGTGTDWVDWLADHDGGAVAMAPFPADGWYGSFEDTTVAMLAAFGHGHPLVNGYSGFFPDQYEALEDEMRDAFPDDRPIAMLRARGVRWIVVDRDWLTPEHDAWMRNWRGIMDPVFEGRDARVYELLPDPKT